MFFGRGLFYYDIYYIILILPVILISGFVQIKLMLVYSKFSKIKNEKCLTGSVVARNILDGAGLSHVRVERVEGHLTDHFDPKSNVVRLSSENYDGCSIAAVGIAAHEVGHAIQFSKNYFPMQIRSKVVVVTNLGSKLFFPILIAGVILSMFKLIVLGIVLFAITVFFEFVTLPVEFNASWRALRILKTNKILGFSELVGVRKVLTVAALTYVTSFLMALMQLIRFILIFMSRRSNDD